MKLPAAVRTAFDAVNSGDTDSFVRLFRPETGYISDWSDTFYGPAEIRKWSERALIGKKVQVKVLHYYAGDDDEVVVIAQDTARGNDRGMTFRFRLQDQHLSHMQVID